MSTWQFIRSLIFFSFLGIGLFVLHLAIVHGARHSERGRIGKINQLMSHKVDRDIMIFGASEGEAGIAPFILEKKLGKTTFNMSIDGMTVSQYGDLVKEYANYGDGQHVILALGIFCLYDRKLPASPNWYYPWINNQYVSNNYLLNRMPEFGRYKNFPLYGFVVFNSGFYRASFDGWQTLITSKKNNSCYTHDGWIPHDLAWGQNNSLQKLTPQKAFLNQNIITQYQDVIRHLNVKGKKVTLVFMPSWKGARSYYYGYDELRAKLKTLAEPANVFIDYSDIPFSENQEYFYNYTHLNKKGAELFSNILADDIASAQPHHY